MDITDKIAEALEMVSDDARAYYNTETREIVWILDFADDNEAIAEDIENNWDKYISLPVKHDINEYTMMSEFAAAFDDTEIRSLLGNCLKGRGVFRRFKDEVYNLEIEKEWFEYRNSAYRKIAEKWYAENKERML